MRDEERGMREENGGREGEVDKSKKRRERRRSMREDRCRR